MPVKHARHIALSAPLAAWVDERIKLGDYTSASDLVRTAIRLLKERDDRKAGSQALSAARRSTPGNRV